MDITVTLSNREEKMLKKIVGNGSRLTIQEYCTNIVKTFLRSQIKGYLQDKFNNKTEEELVEILGDIE